jgi:two-component system phosphate regulon response regulator PhoB
MKDIILVVDDEPDILDLVQFNLIASGFDVITAGDGLEAMEKVKSRMPVLIILDLMLPGMNGMEVCKLLKQDERTASIPIIMLTAKGGEIDRVLGFEMGADDYVTKPFSPRELVLRVKRILQHVRKEEYVGERIAEKELIIDTVRHEVTVNKKPIELTATEFKLLTTLMTRKGRVQSRDQLLRDVWDYDHIVDTRTVDTHVRRLREKLGKASRFVETVRSICYKFISE